LNENEHERHFHNWDPIGNGFQCFIFCTRGTKNTKNEAHLEKFILKPQGMASTLDAGGHNQRHIWQRPIARPAHPRSPALEVVRMC
jgi:hypothetical protein